MIQPNRDSMKEKRGSLFLFSSKEKDNFDDEENKIELVSCLNGGMRCQHHLDLINKRFSASNQYIQNKEYVRSIEELKNAYDETTGLSDSSCVKCAEFFRETITKSLETIQIDLSRMSRGLYRKRYAVSYRLATSTLKELKRKR